MNHRTRYGTMIPSLGFTEVDRPVTGKAFSFVLERVGMMFISDRSVTVDLEQWDECIACEEFEHCYRLCMARLALEHGVLEK